MYNKHIRSQFQQQLKQHRQKQQLCLTSLCMRPNKKSTIPPNSGSGSTNMSCFWGMGARTSLRHNEIYTVLLQEATQSRAKHWYHSSTLNPKLSTQITIYNHNKNKKENSKLREKYRALYK